MLTCPRCGRHGRTYVTKTILHRSDCRIYRIRICPSPSCRARFRTFEQLDPTDRNRGRRPDEPINRAPTRHHRLGKVPEDRQRGKLAEVPELKPDDSPGKDRAKRAAHKTSAERLADKLEHEKWQRFLRRVQQAHQDDEESS